MAMTLFSLDFQGNAVIADDGRVVSYAELKRLSDEWAAAIPPRSLVFILAQNKLDSLVAYVGALNHGIVPLMLDAKIDEALLARFDELYHPAFWYRPGLDGKYELVKVRETSPELYPDLALLITTSGSTGAPKLVRQTYRNLSANAESIAEYLKIDATERPITTLPMNYVYGLSIINSHLIRGATILLTDKTLMQREFWNFFAEQQATSFGGVPYTYEMLDKLLFFRRKLPSLRTMTQAGGKILPALHQKFAEYAKREGKNFVVMYGASEATSRMSYLPPEHALDKVGSMGIAIPGGCFKLIDENGDVILEENSPPELRPLTEVVETVAKHQAAGFSPSTTTDNIPNSPPHDKGSSDEAGDVFSPVGELVYEGPNVTLGYAECVADLSKGDERHGRLVTGDMAKRDADGYYYIVGRKKRFLKIFGNRVNLDETERMIKAHFTGLECACGGVDDRMKIYVTDETLLKSVQDFVADKTHLNFTAFKVVKVDAIPKNDSGKTLYAELEKLNV